MASQSASATDVDVPVDSEKFTAKDGKGTPRLPDIPPTEDDDGKGGNNNGTVPKPSSEDDFAMLARRFEALKKR
jgi:vacuolar protein sorting-associated protein IST1